MKIKQNTFVNINQLKNLKKNLKNKIFGQDEAINILTNYITIYAAGLKEKEKPIGSFLFTGPTGVGKTELVKELANQLNLHFERFDMSEYSSSRSSDTLIGGAAGLVGYEEGGLLTNALLENPNCVLLFDEIEKADPSILNKFLQIMDYGKLTSSKGEKVSFNNAIVIFTSNLGAIKKEKKRAGFSNSSYIEEENSINEFLSPEFIARLNHTIKFNSLSRDISINIIKKYFKQMEKLLAHKNITIETTDKLINQIIDSSDKSLGSRNIQNIITQKIKLIISEELIFGNLKNCSNIIIDWDENISDYKFYISETKKEIIKLNNNINSTFFQDVNEAQEYAKRNIGAVITRSPEGNGYIIK